MARGRSRGRGHPSRRERGAALVEMAIVAPLLLALLLGIADFSLVMFDGATVRQGTRDTARAVAVNRYGNDSACKVTGPAPTTSVHNLICYAKGAIDLDQSDTRINLRFSGDGAELGERVVVCAQYPASSRSGMFSVALDNRIITSRVSMRIEQAGPLVEYAETALAPEGWASCGL